MVKQFHKIGKLKSKYWGFGGYTLLGKCGEPIEPNSLRSPLCPKCFEK